MGGNLPNLVIIGAQKCATTSLHYYLNLHPQIQMSRVKELNFFIRERNWSKGVEWYRSNFPKETKIRGESSPNYTYYPFYKGVPERIHALIPEAKFLIIVRDPIERIVSQYMHKCDSGRINVGIEEALRGECREKLLCRSKYFMQLEQYLRFYPKSSFFFLDYDELKAERYQTLGKTFRFLGVDDTFRSQKFTKVLHKSAFKRKKNPAGVYLRSFFGSALRERLRPAIRGPLLQLLLLPFSKKMARPVLGENTRQELINELKEDTHRFRQFTGMAFKEWGL